MKRHISGRFGMVPSCAYDDKLMTSGLRDVLGTIATHCNQDHAGWGYVEQKTIAGRLGIARETVNRAVKQLIELGYLETRHQFAKSGAQIKNEYRVRYDIDLAVERWRTPPELPDVDEGEDEDVISTSHTPPVISGGGVTQLDHTPVTQLDHTPVTQLDHTIKRMNIRSNIQLDKTQEQTTVPHSERAVSEQSPEQSHALTRTPVARNLPPEPDLMATPHWPTLFAWGRSVDGRRALALAGCFPPYRNSDLLRVYRETQERASQAWNRAIVGPPLAPPEAREDAPPERRKHA